MSKRILNGILVTIIALALMVTGCSSGTTGPAPQEKENPPYPEKQIDVIVPFGAGGGLDLVGRAIAEQVGKEWGQTVNVVNKPGAAGAIGNQEALKGSKPDGYTALIAGLNNSSALLAGTPNLSFNMDDFKWAGKLVEDPIAVIVKADAPWNTLEEFAEWAKANPEKLSYGTTGPTGRPTFSIAELFDKLGIDFSKTNMIVTSGAAEILTQIAGGHVHVGMNSVSEVSNMVKAGKVKMLAVTTKSSYFPDIPTMEDLGYSDFKVNWWLGVAFPKETPDYIVEKWDKAMEKASTDPEFLDKLKAINSEGSYLNAADVKKLADEQYTELSEMAVKFGLRK